jgi:1,4-alpha-glucan branching enzyme
MVKIKVNGEKAWVTFSYTPSSDVESVAVAGEWNEWQEEEMKMKKGGEYSITKILPVGSSYQFGYKINGSAWIVEDECARVESPFFTQNSILVL